MIFHTMEIATIEVTVGMKYTERKKLLSLLMPFNKLAKKSTAIMSHMDTETRQKSVDRFQNDKKIQEMVATTGVDLITSSWWDFATFTMGTSLSSPEATALRGV